MAKLPGPLVKLLEKQQYGFAGSHSAVKICTWTKKSLRDEDYCYKQKFYGIRSHLCCQMSPAVNFCQNACVFCWRDMEFGQGGKIDDPDDPADIINNCITQQGKLLSGFGGYRLVNRKKLAEAREPMHFAISLTGEPTEYPKLSKLIRGLHKRGKTTFLVTNGQNPDVLEKIELPTQLYISVDAPNEDIFVKTVRSKNKDAWKRFLQSLDVLRGLKTRTTLRLTLVKGLNMYRPKQWAELIKRAEPLFVEAKAYMYVGSSRQRLHIENMPRHPEVRAFARKICSYCGYRIIDEKKESRVVLLMKKDSKDRIMRFL
ncbi:MAG: 4-demethylwyosine synthase TYW1 [archaeon]